jgi:hypothetical protein
MIVDENKYLHLISKEMEMEDAVGILKENGLDQMTSVKVVIKTYSLSLREADSFILNSRHWATHKEGNEWLKNAWFQDED